MINKINKSHSFALDLFRSACEKKLGIKPQDDDDMVLEAAINFNTYIKTFTRLDHSIDWQRKFIDKAVETKVNALSERIVNKFGNHGAYLQEVVKRNQALRNKL